MHGKLGSRLDLGVKVYNARPVLKARTTRKTTREIKDTGQEKNL
jgi:hypothetical protein